MISASTAFYKAVRSENREFHIRDTYTFSNGKVIEMETGDFVAYTIDEDITDSGKLTLGATAIKKYTAVLDNTDRKYDLYNFAGCKIESRIGLRLEDGTIEEIQKGVFWITKATFSSITMKIEAADAMMFFEKPYETELDFNALGDNATTADIVKEACEKCGVPIRETEWVIEIDNLKQHLDFSLGLTFRDIISAIAQLMIRYAKIDPYGYLVFNYFEVYDANNQTNLYSTYPSGYTCLMGYADGGWFDQGDEAGYLSGETWDGGTFGDGRRWDSPDVNKEGENGIYDGIIPDGSIDGNRYGYHIYEIGSQEINTVDARIAGMEVRTYPYDEYQEERLEWSLAEKTEGVENFIQKVKKNPFIFYVNNNVPQMEMLEIFKQKQERICGSVRPLKVSCKSDPRLEPGDFVIVTDRDNRSHRTILTRVNFTIGGLQKIECSIGTNTNEQYGGNNAENIDFDYYRDVVLDSDE